AFRFFQESYSLRRRDLGQEFLDFDARCIRILEKLRHTNRYEAREITSQTDDGTAHTRSRVRRKSLPAIDIGDGASPNIWHKVPISATILDGCSGGNEVRLPEARSGGRETTGLIPGTGGKGNGQVVAANSHLATRVSRLATGRKGTGQVVGAEAFGSYDDGC